MSELLEGETLRERLSSGPLPARKAIDLGIQIALGRAAAHEKGIVHRDLKPENIFITNDGRAKILDFGLAKLTQPEGGIATATDLPTTPVHTQDGMVLGTIGYMAPEQVRGLPADHRADIFSFGAVLYEMLSGRRAFRGDTTADTMTAILKEDPPDLPVDERHIPPALVRIIDRCLEKAPLSRFGTAADLAFALDALSAHSGATAAAGSMPASRTMPGRTVAWLAAALSLLLLAAVLPFVFAHLRETPANPGLVRFTISPPGSEIFGFAPATVSPDGRQVAFVATSVGATSIWIRSLDALEPRVLAATQGAQAPFWAPDSRSVAFFADNKLKKIDVSAGSPQVLCEASGTAGGGAWSRDGVIVFGRVGSGGLFRVAADDGQPERITSVSAERRETAHFSPAFLPDGRRFVYAVAPANKIYLGSLDSPDTKELTDATSKAIVSLGHLLFTRQGTLMAQPFDADRGELRGEPVPIAEQLGTGAGSGGFSVSDNGVLIYRKGLVGFANQVMSFDRAAKPLRAVGEPGDYRDISLSPDGTRVMLHRHEDPNGGGLWMIDAVRGTTSRFTFSSSHDVQAQWAGDGLNVVFGSNRDGSVSNLYRKVSSLAGDEELLLRSSQNKGASDWSADGRFIVYEVDDAKTQTDIWVLPLSGDPNPMPFLQTEFAEGQARLSPNAHWMAYTSNETGKNEVYVEAFPRSGRKQLISTNGGAQPRWRRDGRELFYLGPTTSPGLLSITAVDVRATAATFEVGAPKGLFNGRFSPNVGVVAAINTNSVSQSYVASADGQSFLVLTPAGDPAPQVLNVVLNWTAALKK